MADNSIPHDKYAGITHEMLGGARDAWVNRHYPTAKNIGDVVLDMRAGAEPDLTFEEARKATELERETAEDAALREELDDFEPLRDVPRTSKPFRSQTVYKGHRPPKVVNL